MSDKSRYGDRNNNQIIPKEIHLGAERLARALKIPDFAEKERKQSLPIEPKIQKRINEERQ
ncbi:MAG: hypothetical protein OXE77_06690 [Flavobacteriaceae bacterium]|nr:hypothetical protein [Flavobacteriaceae bacterium]MCY4268444.1 hypothetical protein [Flavobacteriaceae bacterium]MCY4299932.1 hypothetical protein [Flavobacteriaceae bacterium]